MSFAIALAIFLVYLVMASQFESLAQPFVIMFAIPFGLIGVIAALYLTDQAVNVVVLIGLIVLAGIVVNNAIGSCWTWPTSCGPGDKISSQQSVKPPASDYGRF